MSASDRQKLRQATEAAWQSARSQTVGSDREPRPGDLFVLEETSHLAVEWAVLECDPASHRLFAVPVDTWRQVGSHDVHVATSPSGPSSLRCDLGLWLPPETFDPELRSGVLDSADLDRARQTWRSIENGEVDASAAQRETDTELEYRDWIENGPKQARALLTEHAPAPVVSSAPGRLQEKTRNRRDPRRYLALAASLFLAMTLAAGSAWIWRARTERGEIGQARTPWTVSLVRTRGGLRKIVAPSGVESLELRITDIYPEPYRIEVRSEDPPRTIQTFAGSTVILPRRVLPAGEYRIVVLALRDGGEEPIGLYRIDLEYQEHENRP